MPSATPSSHRQKRAFLPSNQTSLDTFFRNAFSGDPPSPSQTSFERDALSPALPATIQSNLLTVGMRVRKSVPEGYKTHKLGFHDIRSSDIRLPEAMTATNAARPPELQPFCGLLNVGGYGPQERTYTTSTYANEDITIDTNAFGVQQPDPYMLPFSSQESNISTASNFSTDSMPARNPILQPSFSNANTNAAKRVSKRTLQEDDDAEPEQSFQQSQPHTSRAFARPKLSRRRSPRLAQQQSTLHIFNFNIPPENAAEFEEATFFKADEWKTNDMDIENDF